MLLPSIEPASNPKVEHKTRGFLQGLNSSEGMVQLNPYHFARQYKAQQVYRRTNF
jgi:hypothetical protein